MVYRWNLTGSSSAMACSIFLGRGRVSCDGDLGADHEKAKKNVVGGEKQRLRKMHSDGVTLSKGG